MSKFARLVLQFTAACVVVLASASSAQATFGVTITGGPASLQAGAHPNLALTLSFTGSEKVDDLDLNLPPGLVGDPGAVSHICTVAEAHGAGCPATSQVGSAVADSTATLLTGPLDAQATGEVYVMQPVGDEPARLWLKLTPQLAGLPAGPPITSESAINLRSPGDFGLTTLVRNLPEQADLFVLGTVPIKLNALSLTLFGTPPNSPTRPFISNPTSCGAKTVTVDATSKNGSKASDATDPFTISGCNAVPFTPSLAVTPTTMTAGQPAPIAVSVKFPPLGNGTAQSHVKNTTVTLPEGAALSAGVGAAGLEGCTAEQFAPNAPTAPTCPALSNTGTVLFDSPLVGAVPGTVFLGTSTPDAKFRLFAYAKKGQVQIKLVGRVLADEKTGQLTTIFENTPQQPFSAFTLSFRGGDNGALKAPDACGEYTATSTLDPYSGTAAAHPTAKFNVVGCPPPQFAPTFTASATPTQAGADTVVHTVISRTDADERLAGIKVSMPPGLLGRIGSVPPCSLDSARAAACTDASLIGSVVTSAGTGGTPVSLPGKVYLTDGIDGSIAGLAIIVAAKVGPIDLGNVIVLGKLVARGDVGIDLSVDSIPPIIGGVPMYIRSMDLTLDRPGFLFNASSCKEQQVSATFTALSGATANAAIPYQATGCENLPFAPTLTAKVEGSAKAPGFTSSVLGTPGDSTLEGLKLTLPPALTASLASLSRTCPVATYNEGGCAASAIVGSVRAESPLIPLPLTGPVTLVKLDGVVLPALAMKLRGSLNLDLLVQNNVVGGRLESSISGVPDAPISKFDLSLAPGGLLQSSKSALCDTTQNADGAFVAHSGKTSKSVVKVDVSAICGSTTGQGGGTAGKVTAKGTLKGFRKGGVPSLRLRLSGKNIKLTSLGVNLAGSRLKLVRAKAKRLARGVVGGKLKRLTVAGSKVTAKATSKGTRAIELRVGKGALRKGTVKVGQRLTLKLTYTQAGSKKSKTLKVKIRAAR